MQTIYSKKADPRRKGGKTRKRKRTAFKQEESYSRSKMGRILDSLHARHIRGQYTACVTCGQTARNTLTCSHILPRFHPATRWDAHEGGNCVVQCARCNEKHETDPTPLYAWYVNKYGAEALTALRLRANTGHRPNVFLEEDLLKQFGYKKLAPDRRVHTPPGWEET